MDFESIDWDGMWREEATRSSWNERGQAKEVWDKRAAGFNKGVKRLNGDTPGDGTSGADGPGADKARAEAPRRKSDYIAKMLDRIHVEPQWTVLDLGCGPGTLAIPLAQKAKSVTGLDVSSEMLRFLSENAQKSGLDNVECVNASWQDGLGGGEIEPHDVVVASRCLMGPEIKGALAAIDRLARHGVYVTFPVMHLSLDWDAHRAVGRGGKKYPPYIYVLNMLYQMDIRANLEILESTMRLEFASIDEAIEQISWRTDPFSDEELVKLRRFLEDTFASQSEPPLVHEGRSIWALVWWEKGAAL